MSDAAYRDCPRCKRSTVETLEWVGPRIPARCSACGATWPDLGFYICEVEDGLGLRALEAHLTEIRTRGGVVYRHCERCNDLKSDVAERTVPPPQPDPERWYYWLCRACSGALWQAWEKEHGRM